MMVSASLVHVNGWQRSFQPLMNPVMASISSSTEVKVPRRMAWRVMIPKKISSGSPGALLRRGPLRTGRARFPGNRLKQALKACGQYAVVLSRRRRRWFGGGSGRV